VQQPSARQAPPPSAQAEATRATESDRQANLLRRMAPDEKSPDEPQQPHHPPRNPKPTQAKPNAAGQQPHWTLTAAAPFWNSRRASWASRPRLSA